MVVGKTLGYKPSWALQELEQEKWVLARPLY